MRQPTYLNLFSKLAMAIDTPANPTHESHVRNSPRQVQPGAKVSWSTGLCDCFSDVPNCCMTFWCPCVTFGRIAEIVDSGSSSCALNGLLYTLVAFTTGCACLCSCFNRSKMRKQYKLEGNDCKDCLAHYFCEACALCQEYRELKNRGFDMTLGWHGNMQKQGSTPAATTVPAVEGGMYR